MISPVGSDGGRASYIILYNSQYQLRSHPPGLCRVSQGNFQREKMNYTDPAKNDVVNCMSSGRFSTTFASPKSVMRGTPWSSTRMLHYIQNQLRILHESPKTYAFQIAMHYDRLTIMQI